MVSWGILDVLRAKSTKMRSLLGNKGDGTVAGLFKGGDEFDGGAGHFGAHGIEYFAGLWLHPTQYDMRALAARLVHHL